VVLAALLWGGTRLAQGGLYEDPVTDLYWRAPAAAGTFTAFLALWCLLNYARSTPGESDLPFEGLFNFASEKTSEPVKEFSVVRSDGERKRYHLRIETGPPPRFSYLDNTNRQWQSTQARETEAIIVKEDGQEVRFKTDPQRNLWKEEGGQRVMGFDIPGRIITLSPGRSVLSVVLNLVHLAVWFVCLWPLLRFQWPHALLGAAVVWLAMTFVVPNIFAKIPRKTPSAATAQVISPAKSAGDAAGNSFPRWRFGLILPSFELCPLFGHFHGHGHGTQWNPSEAQTVEFISRGGGRSWNETHSVKLNDFPPSASRGETIQFGNVRFGKAQLTCNGTRCNQVGILQTAKEGQQTAAFHTAARLV
jgi:hypothetical protein